MTKVEILPATNPKGDVSFHAFSGKNHCVGKTAGEALDSLTSLLPLEENATLVIVQNCRPDSFFSRDYQEQLGLLMKRWRSARDSGTSLSLQEQSDLKSLVEKELQAATNRAAAMVEELKS